MPQSTRRGGLILAFTVAVAGCPGDDSTGVTEDVVSALITHEDGFDFSDNMAQTDFQANDGDVISWQPGNETNPSYPSGANLWWRNDVTTSDGSNATTDMGAVALSSVTSIPATFEQSPNISPLLVGNVYVAKCHDGYVKFKVTALDLVNWTANVDFVFTAGTSFGQ